MRSIEYRPSRWSPTKLLLYATGASLPFVFGGDGVLLTTCAVAPLVGICFTAALSAAGRGTWARPRSFLFALALVTLPTLGLVVSGANNESAKRWLYHALGFLSFVAASEHFRRGRLVWRDVLIMSNVFAGSLGAYFVATSALAIRDYGFAATVAQRYVGGVMSLPWGTTNLVAGVLLFPVLLASGLVFSGDGSLRITAVYGAVGGAAGIGMTLSRTSIALTVAGGAFLVVTQLRRRRSRVAVLVLGALLIMGINELSAETDWALVDAFQERLERGSSSLNGRTEVWADYLDQLAASSELELLFGRGLFMNYVNNGYSTHNVVLSFLYDVGVIGLALAAGIGIAFVRLIPNTPLRIPLLIALAAAIACSMVEDIMYAQQSILYGWLMVAAVCCAPTHTAEPPPLSVRGS